MECCLKIIRNLITINPNNMKTINLNEYKALKSITFSAHKIYGPKGIGSLIIKKDENNVKIPLIPLFHGGEQEYGYRAGTLSNELIVGFLNL